MHRHGSANKLTAIPRGWEPSFPPVEVCAFFSFFQRITMKTRGSTVYRGAIITQITVSTVLQRGTAALSPGEVEGDEKEESRDRLP